jgi:hypothetical protein
VFWGVPARLPITAKHGIVAQLQNRVAQMLRTGFEALTGRFLKQRS